MEPAQSLKASGVHATLCAAVPWFSCAGAIVEQDAIAANAAKISLYFDIFDPSSLILALDLRATELKARPPLNRGRAADDVDALVVGQHKRTVGQHERKTHMRTQAGFNVCGIRHDLLPSANKGLTRS